MRTKVGYTGGTTPGPSYQYIGDHIEAIEIEYDPELTTYEDLLELFWNNHNPTLKCKRQYMSAIFFHDNDQKEAAKMSKENVQKKYCKPVLTKVLPAVNFYLAEIYHQKCELQNSTVLWRSLGLHQDDLVNSYVATRINGYLSGYGSLKKFDAEWQFWGISEEQAGYIKKVICRKAKP